MDSHPLLQRDFHVKHLLEPRLYLSMLAANCLLTSFVALHGNHSVGNEFVLYLPHKMPLRAHLAPDLALTSR